jgi:hypothetical protein
MVSEKTYIKLLKKVVSSTTGVRGFFVSDDCFDEIHSRMQRIGHRYHKQYKLKVFEDEREEVHSSSLEVLKLENTLFKEGVNRTYRQLYGGLS